MEQLAARRRWRWRPGGSCTARLESGVGDCLAAAGLAEWNCVRGLGTAGGRYKFLVFVGGPVEELRRQHYRLHRHGVRFWGIWAGGGQPLEWSAVDGGLVLVQRQAGVAFCKMYNVIG